MKLIHCLDAILNYVDGFHATSVLSHNTLSFATEAAWSTGKWEQLERLLGPSSGNSTNLFVDFNVGVGRALLALRNRKEEEFIEIISLLRDSLAKGLTPSTTSSIQASHEQLVKLHALYEIEAVSGMTSQAIPDREVILDNLDRRLDIIGAYTSDKQYLLGVRRAAMSLSR